ncbi:MAG: lysoplasmalogenase [Bacteroidetes bacterium]|nr:lysoplasmalogenase [Bacteroidota bacterium]
MSNRFFLFAFLLIATSEILIQVFDLQEFNFILKPLIVPSLSIFYFQNVGFKNRLFALALLFCWAGDVFLLFDHVNELYFMGGLGSFLVAHILLFFLYGKLKHTKVEGLPAGQAGLNGPQRARVSFPVILAGTGVITILYPSLGALKIPVIIYALALMLMVLQSIYRYGFTSAQSFWNVCIGALLFMLSDSLLAINKFFQPIANAGVLVIATYMAALYFIVRGVIAHKGTKDQLNGSNGKVNSNSVY